VIGREAGNDIVIEDPQVSRRHAQLTQQGNSYLTKTSAAPMARTSTASV